MGLDTPQAVKLFSNGSFCTRVGSDGFKNALLEFKSELGLDTPQAVTLFSNNSFCKRVESSGFKNALLEF
eukprot:3708229-Prymnesium_polylepis.1